MELDVNDIILNDAKTNIEHNILIYSNFFEYKKQKNELGKEILFVFLFNICVHTKINILSRILLFDSLFQSILFYLEYKNYKLLFNKQYDIIERYIYYIFLAVFITICNCITIYHYYYYTQVFTSILYCPTILAYIVNIVYYKKYRNYVYNTCNKIINTILCKQILKIINIVITHILHIKIISPIQYSDIVPFYNNCSWYIVNKFIISFLIACIFNYLDKGVLKLPLIICKNVYMKDTKYNIADDKQYIQQIINDKQWNKLLDVYTLNRIIRLCFMNTNNSFARHTTNNIIFRFNRLMFCYAVLNAFGMVPSILCFLLFIKKTNAFSYIMNTILFIYISYFTTEQFLILVLCEIFYLFIDLDIVKIFMDAYRYNNQ